MSEKVLIFGYGRTTSGVILLLGFGMTPVFGFSCRPAAYPVLVSWAPKQYQAQLPSHGVVLRASQRVVGYSYNIRATIVLALVWSGGKP